MYDYESSGIQICAQPGGSEAGISEAGLALNSNFKVLAGLLSSVQNPMTSNLDAGTHHITDLGAGSADTALAVNSGSKTSLDGGKITTDGSGGFVVGATQYPTAMQLQGGYVPTIGFNCTWNGSNWLFGAGSTSKYASLVQGDTANGSISLVVTSSPGNAGGTVSFIFGIHITNGGRVLVGNGTSDDGTSTLLAGQTSLDGGKITTDGVGTLCLHSQSAAPTAVAGGIYFDGTNFHFCKVAGTWIQLILP